MKTLLQPHWGHPLVAATLTLGLTLWSVVVLRPEAEPRRDHLRTRSSLNSIRHGLAYYAEHLASTRPCSSLAELVPDVLAEEVLRSPLTGQFFQAVSAFDPEHHSDILVCDVPRPNDDGVFVLWADGRVDWLSTEQLDAELRGDH